MEILTWHARQKQSLTLQQLSELTGIGKSTLNRIENGQTSPTISQLEAIAKVTGTRITDLFLSDYK